MSYKIFIISLMIIVSVPLASAQERSEESSGNNKKSEFSDKFFLALTTSTYTDIIVSPLRYFRYPTGNFIQQGSDSTFVPEYGSIPFQSQQFNIISLGLEPRYNLKEFDENSSLSISAPVSFGIGSSFSAAGDDLIVRGVEGFGSIQIPLLLKYNIGNGSTYTTQKDFGFSAGAGLEFNKIGLINLTAESKKYNKGFVLPSFSAGVTFMRGNSPMEINFKYAFGELRSQETDTQDDPLKDNSGVLYKRSTRAQSIKLSFVYLMNY